MNRKDYPNSLARLAMLLLVLMVGTQAWGQGITVAEDPASTYVPTTIVNGSFDQEPWMVFTYQGTTYYTCRNDASFISPSDDESGYAQDIVFNGVDGGWNTTDRYFWRSSLFEYTDSDNGTHNHQHNSSIPRTDKYVEMNNFHSCMLYQDLTTYGHDVIRWTLKHAVTTSGDETQPIRVEIGAPNRDGEGHIINASGWAESLNPQINLNTKAIFRHNGVTDKDGNTSTIGFGSASDLQYLQLTKTSNGSGWWTAQGVYTIPDGQTVTRFGFISEAATNNMGNLLDDLTFTTLIGNLSAQQLANGDVELKGYWGETNTSKRLKVVIGTTTHDIDMTSVIGKNFRIVIPSATIGSATSVHVYHQDYEDAGRTIEVTTAFESWQFGYTGTIQSFTAPHAGIYQLRVWGAQGGNRTHMNNAFAAGGLGGYATCRTNLTAGETIYVYVGGQGGTVASDNNLPAGAGGWNGGGAGGNGASNHSGSAGGGGATHISKVSNQIIGNGCDFLGGTNYIIVAGGGGGAGHNVTTAGAGGGTTGGYGTYYTSTEPHTEEHYNANWYYSDSDSRGAQGGHGLTGASTSCEGAGGGGGGYLGGNANEAYNTFTTTYQDAGGCGGNSAYNSNLATDFSTTAGQREGNGLAQIILLLQGSGTSDDPYLIPSEAAWNYLADQVNSGTTYSGKYFRLTNDISVTTMAGNSSDHSFRGTFDGYGHTLTITLSNSSDFTAPFRYIQGATFKNLKVTGTISTTMNYAAGLAGLNTNATATFDQCVTDVAINSSSTTGTDWGTYDYHGALLARSNSANVNITDCVCGGSVDGSSSAKSYCAGLVGVAVSSEVSATRCLSTTSYSNVYAVNSLCHSDGATRIADVFYYVNGNDGACPETQVTTSQLAAGSYATALQANRATTIWVQYTRTNQPMLKQFTKYTVTYHANGGSGSVPAAQTKQEGDNLTLSNGTLTFNSDIVHSGWRTTPDGAGTHYDKGGTYSANADVTLYAEWSFTESIAARVWQAISTPVHNAGQNYVSVSNVVGLTTPTYDLFRYNETAAKWENYRSHNGESGSTDNTFTSLAIGRGYIYRRSTPATLTFTGLPNGENTYSITLTANGSSDLQGFNLVGNPYPFKVKLDRAYYSLNADGTWQAHGYPHNDSLEVGQGVLVYTAETSGESLTFYAATRSTNASSKSALPPLPKGFCLSGDCDQDDSQFSTLNSQFAYYEGDHIVITGTGTLQAFDIMGRQLLSKEINSQLSILNSQFPHAGVYILRLDGRSQKIVIK